MLTPFVAGKQKIPVGTRMVVVLLDQLNLKLPRIAECERQMRGRCGFPTVAVINRHAIPEEKKGTDPQSFRPIAQCPVEIAYDECDLPHLTKNSAHNDILLFFIINGYEAPTEHHPVKAVDDQQPGQQSNYFIVCAILATVSIVM